MSKLAYDSFLKNLRSSVQGYGQEVFAEDNKISPLFVTVMPQLYVHMCYLLEIFESKDTAL